MIPKEGVRGSNLVGLLRYLWGPGRYEEHFNPHLVAAFDGAGDLSALEPVLEADGHRSYERLESLLKARLLARVGKPPKEPIWHCSLRLDPSDPVLSDARWARIATEFMELMGLDSAEQPGVHWMAMRHGDDHIHIAAVLVRPGGWVEKGWRSMQRAQEAARELERRYGLVVVGPADRTAARAVSQGEWRRAQREGAAEPARPRLLRAVRAAAATAVGEEEFFRLLRERGVQVKLRYSDKTPGEVTGYSVAIGDEPGKQILFGGSKLAADLSLPRLRARWMSVDGVPPVPKSRPDVYRLAALAVRGAARHMRAQGLTYPDLAAATALAAADLLTATAYSLEGQAGGPVTRVALVLDRAAREVGGRVPVRRTPMVGRLRHMSQLVGGLGYVIEDRQLVEALRLLAEMVDLAEWLAELRMAQQRQVQAAAAELAARQLRDLAGSVPDGRPRRGPSPRTPDVPSWSGPVAAAQQTEEDNEQVRRGAGVDIGRSGVRGRS